MNKEDTQKIYNYKEEERLKHKRCKWCKFLKFWKKKTYLLGGPEYKYYCMYTDKVRTTEDIFWNIRGCFCSLYEPEEVQLEEEK